MSEHPKLTPAQWMLLSEAVKAPTRINGWRQIPAKNLIRLECAKRDYTDGLLRATHFGLAVWQAECDRAEKGGAA
jgi:hypothetical protein